MSGEMDDAKGRMKEAVGALADNGTSTRARPMGPRRRPAKDKIDKAADWVKDKVDDAKK